MTLVERLLELEMFLLANRKRGWYMTLMVFLQRSVLALMDMQLDIFK